MNTTIDWQIVRHQVSIAGIVQDSETKQAIAGARVEIDHLKDTHSQKWTLTGVDGWFYFLDLPPKNNGYTLSASLPNRGTRYGVVSSEAISVISGRVPLNSPSLNMVMHLPPTALSGRITDEQNKGLKLAKVQLQPGGETVFSDEKGNYFLSGLNVGSITINISAQSYQSKTQSASLALGQKIIMNDIQLSVLQKSP